MLDTIAFHARRTPARIALIDPVAGETSYDEAHRLVVALADKLQREIPDLRDLQPVAVACSDVRWHLLLTFALEALGIAVLAFVEPPDPGLRVALKLCPLLIGEAGPVASAQRYFGISKRWFESVKAEPQNARFQARSPGGPMTWWRFSRPRAPTGAAKCIALHREAYDLREQNRVWQYGLCAESRYLVAMPISVSIVAMVARANAALWRQSAVLGFGQCVDRRSLDHPHHVAAHTLCSPFWHRRRPTTGQRCH